MNIDYRKSKVIFLQRQSTKFADKKTPKIQIYGAIPSLKLCIIILFQLKDNLHFHKRREDLIKATSFRDIETSNGKGF